MTALSLPTVAMDAHPCPTPVINSPDPDQPRYLFPPLSLLSGLLPHFLFLPLFSSSLFRPGSAKPRSSAAHHFLRKIKPSLNPQPTNKSPFSISVTELASRGLNLSFFFYYNLFDKEACFEPTPSFLPDQNLFNIPSLPSGQEP